MLLRNVEALGDVADGRELAAVEPDLDQHPQRKIGMKGQAHRFDLRAAESRIIAQRPGSRRCRRHRNPRRIDHLPITCIENTCYSAKPFGSMPSRMEGKRSLQLRDLIYRNTPRRFFV